MRLSGVGKVEWKMLLSCIMGNGIQSFRSLEDVLASAA